MRSTVALLLALTLAAPAFPSIVEGNQVMYVGGTIAGLQAGAMGRLDLTQNKSLVFEAAGTRCEIPYAQISSHAYARKLARRMGAIATVAVVLIKRRQRRHFIEIDFQDEAGTAQVAIFEIAKDAVQTVSAVLDARAPNRRVQASAR